MRYDIREKLAVEPAFVQTPDAMHGTRELRKPVSAAERATSDEYLIVVEKMK